jgi:preprotein translocase subunit SecA
MLKIFEKIFGSKHEKDVKKIQPVISSINELQISMASLSDDQLREKGLILKQKVRATLEPIELEKKSLSLKLDNPNINLEEAESINARIDTLTEEYEKSTAAVLEELLPETFALVKETCVRLKGLNYLVMGRKMVWDMVPYDVQLIGGVVLHSGKISEMATGEGKTLVSTLPVFLNALTGRGVHVVTVNDYLAQRDKEWMSPVFAFHNISLGVILNTMIPEERREQYACDITYGTNNEFGFDYLRDNMAGTPEEMVQRDFYYAIVDEVDSVLIDEARTPLIISGPVPNADNSKFQDIKPWIEQLVRAQQHLVATYLGEAEKLLKTKPGDVDAGLALLRVKRGQPKNTRYIKMLAQAGVAKLVQITENDYLKDNSSRMQEVDDALYYAVDEKAGTIDLTDKGREFLSKLSHQDSDIFMLPDVGSEVAIIESDASIAVDDKIQKKDEVYRLFADRSERLHNISQLLKAYSLFERDDEYVVQNGQVMIVDEFTGRILPGRRYSDGLHQAIEAKENVKIEGETQTMATITIQNFFRLYKKLAGMTGTAETEASEFYEIYKLDVVVIPTNAKIVRKDMDDLVYKTRREKYNAVVLKVEELQKKGQPVLVGTTSVEVSETLSRMLRARKIVHNVLKNAKQNDREAEIVAEAGQKNAVTIATNMAGRGTDIKLGEGVRELGGLFILGSERHESRRIDRQLRGRAGRQGDPGESVFFVSLEDELMRLFGSDRVISVMDRLGHEEGDVIEHSMITKSIERAQKKVEEQNFAIRKRLLEYDDVLSQQREVIYSRRRNGLLKERLTSDILDLLKDYSEQVIKKYHKQLDVDGIEEELMRELSIEFKPERDVFEREGVETTAEKLYQTALAFYRRKEAAVPEEIMQHIEKYAVLSVIDLRWREHLREIDSLREGINLRAYGQKDPLLEYKQEAFRLFIDLLHDIELETLSLAFKLFPVNPDEAREMEEQQRKAAVRQEKLVAQHQAVDSFYNIVNEESEEEGEKRVQQPIIAEKKPGRNDDCPCGSGKKYKACCGQHA